MKKSNILSSLIVTLIVLSASTKAETLLSGYEPSETNLTLSSPDNMTITKVAGGIDGIPVATEGNYVLKLDWTGDDNFKVELKHEWTGCYTFDLAGYDEILVDVYLATSSAEPNIVGLWDDVFGWVEGTPVPKSLNTWNTISYDISGRTDVGLDHIYALVFEQLHGDSGTIYIDNLRLIPRRTISFSGYDWTVLQSDWEIGSGPCYYTSEQSDVWVDSSGYLHLSILYKDPNWYCSEVISDTSFGYGTYVYTVQGDINALDQNVILGLFVYDVPDHIGNPREIDVELSRWGNPLNENAQYVVQPHNRPENKERFNIAHTENRFTTTHVFIWTEDGIYFWSYYGDFTLCPNPNDIISSWFCSSADIPLAGCEKPRINFYLNDRQPPSNGQISEIIIKNFQYISDVTPAIDLSDFAFFASHWLEENCGECWGLDCNNDENLNVDDFWCCLIPNWTTIIPPVIFVEAQLVGSWGVDVDTGEWSGYSTEATSVSTNFECKVGYYGGNWWYTGLLPLNYYYAEAGGIYPFIPSGDRAAYLYKIELPVDDNVNYVEVAFRKRPYYVGKYISYYVGVPNLMPPHSFPLNIEANVKIDYSFEFPSMNISPVGQYNLNEDNIGGNVEYNLYECEPDCGIIKETSSYLSSESVVKNIPVNNTINTIWISVYPTNIQSMKSQIEPHATEALDDTDIWEGSWKIQISANYTIEWIHFH